MPDTPLQMLLRGQNLVGYRNYADDVVAAFVEEAAASGIDIFRVFDALNDERNFIAAFKAIRKSRKHAQGCISYSLTERRLGGPIFNINYFVNKAKTLEEMGADSICIKDMAGLLSPYDAYDLISALRQAVDVPIQLHTHYTSGMASMTCLKAIEAGVDVIDTSLAPFALRSSQPAIEPIVVALQGTERDTGLDLTLLFQIGERLEALAPRYRDYLDNTKMSVIDTSVLIHQIPGGMTTNLVSQLREAKALEKIKDVYEELPRTRKDLGYPPLVTPTSQIVGIQAVQNVLFGRYNMVSTQVKDYCYGLYGQPPAPIDRKVQKMVLKGYERGEKPITTRAADALKPELHEAREKTKGIAKDMADVLTYALYPVTGLRFLRWKYGLEEAPPDVRGKTLDDIRREDELIAKAKKGLLVEKTQKAVPPKGPSVREFNVFVEDEYYRVEVEEVGGRPLVTSVRPFENGRSPSPPPKEQAPRNEEPERKIVPAREVRKEAAVPENGKCVIAPMPGLVIKYEVKVGDKVREGDNVVILEAMKMQMNITAPSTGTVSALCFSQGDSVEKNAVLAVIA
jgi:pyruvate carboxylase subunit B